MTTASTTPMDRGPAAPREAAIAGVISAILCIAGLTLAMLAFSGAQASTPVWLKGNVGALHLALNMAPLPASTETLWLRTGVMPRWPVFLSYLLALVLLLVFNLSRWIILVFPTWMLMVSLIMLAGNARRRPAELAA